MYKLDSKEKKIFGKQGSKVTEVKGGRSWETIYIGTNINRFLDAMKMQDVKVRCWMSNE